MSGDSGGGYGSVQAVLDDLSVVNDRFQRELEDYPLVDGDIVGARISELSRSGLVLRGRKPVEENNTYNPFAGPSVRSIRAAVTWLDDDRFVGDGGSGWVRWKSIAFGEGCLTALASSDEQCPDCGADGFVPMTPSVMYFEETRTFTDRYSRIETVLDSSR